MAERSSSEYLAFKKNYDILLNLCYGIESISNKAYATELICAELRNKCSDKTFTEKERIKFFLDALEGQLNYVPEKYQHFVEILNDVNGYGWIAEKLTRSLEEELQKEQLSHASTAAIMIPQKSHLIGGLGTSPEQTSSMAMTGNMPSDSVHRGSDTPTGSYHMTAGSLHGGSDTPTGSYHVTAGSLHGGSDTPTGSYHVSLHGGSDTFTGSYHVTAGNSIPATLQGISRLVTGDQIVPQGNSNFTVGARDVITDQLDASSDSKLKTVRFYDQRTEYLSPTMPALQPLRRSYTPPPDQPYQPPKHISYITPSASLQSLSGMLCTCHRAANFKPHPPREAGAPLKYSSAPVNGSNDYHNSPQCGNNTNSRPIKASSAPVSGSDVQESYQAHREDSVLKEKGSSGQCSSPLCGNVSCPASRPISCCQQVKLKVVVQEETPPKDSHKVSQDVSGFTSKESQRQASDGDRLRAASFGSIASSDSGDYFTPSAEKELWSEDSETRDACPNCTALNKEIQRLREKNQKLKIRLKDSDNNQEVQALKLTIKEAELETKKSELFQIQEELGKALSRLEGASFMLKREETAKDHALNTIESLLRSVESLLHVAQNSGSLQDRLDTIHAHLPTQAQCHIHPQNESHTHSQDHTHEPRPMTATGLPLTQSSSGEDISVIHIPQNENMKWRKKTIQESRKPT